MPIGPLLVLVVVPIVVAGLWFAQTRLPTVLSKSRWGLWVLTHQRLSGLILLLGSTLLGFLVSGGDENWAEEPIATPFAALAAWGLFTLALGDFRPLVILGRILSLYGRSFARSWRQLRGKVHCRQCDRYLGNAYADTWGLLRGNEDSVAGHIDTILNNFAEFRCERCGKLGCAECMEQTNVQIVRKPILNWPRYAVEQAERMDQLRRMERGEDIPRREQTIPGMEVLGHRDIQYAVMVHQKCLQATDRVMANRTPSGVVIREYPLT